MENSNELAKNFRLTRNSPGRGGGGAPGHLLTGGASENPSHFLRGRGATVVFFGKKIPGRRGKTGGDFDMMRNCEKSMLVNAGLYEEAWQGISKMAHGQIDAKRACAGKGDLRGQSGL